MAIDFEIDMELLTKYAYLFNLGGVGSADKSSDTKGASEPDSAKGTKFYEQQGYNKDNLVRDLNLNDPKVRYSIIRKLRSHDIVKLLAKLSKKDLLKAMKFFTHDKLVSLLSALPEDVLSIMIGNMFSPKQIMSMLPKNTVEKFLQNSKVSQKNILKFMEKEMKVQDLKEMLACTTGQMPDTNDKSVLIGTFASLKPEVFKESLTYMSYKNVKEMGAFVLGEQPDLLKEIPSSQLGFCLDKSMKSEIIEGMDALEPDVLSELAENLPDELMQQVVTMLDPDVLAEYLLQNCTDVLDDIAA